MRIYTAFMAGASLALANDMSIPYMSPFLSTELIVASDNVTDSGSSGSFGLSARQSCQTGYSTVVSLSPRLTALTR